MILVAKRHLFTAIEIHGPLVLYVARPCPLADNPVASVAPSWRRGWVFEVALAVSARAPTEGASPLVRSPRGGHTPRDLPIQIPPSAWPLSRKRHLFTAMVFYGSLVQLARPCPLANDPSASVAPSWRRGWDLNPRCRCQHTCSPGTPNRPLSHLSAPSVSKERGILARDPSSGKAGQPRNVSPA